MTHTIHYKQIVLKPGQYDQLAKLYRGTRFEALFSAGKNAIRLTDEQIKACIDRVNAEIAHTRAINPIYWELVNLRAELKKNLE
jgi:hypothetical protein